MSVPKALEEGDGLSLRGAVAINPCGGSGLIGLAPPGSTATPSPRPGSPMEHHRVSRCDEHRRMGCPTAFCQGLTASRRLHPCQILNISNKLTSVADRAGMGSVLRRDYPMRALLRSFLEHALLVVGAFPTGATTREEIESLLRKLFPKSCARGFLRLGPEGDGGYLVPNDLMGIEACFSPGVGGESGFERECAEMGMRVFLADGSVDQPSETHELFSFTNKFVGVTSNEDFMTMNEWVTSSLPGSTGSGTA